VHAIEARFFVRILLGAALAAEDRQEGDYDQSWSQPTLHPEPPFVLRFRPGRIANFIEISFFRNHRLPLSA